MIWEHSQRAFREDMRRRRRRREVWHWVLHLRSEERRAQVGTLYVHRLRNCVPADYQFTMAGDTSRLGRTGHDQVYKSEHRGNHSIFLSLLYALIHTFMPNRPSQALAANPEGATVPLASTMRLAPSRWSARSEGDMIVVECRMWLLPPL